MDGCKAHYSGGQMVCDHCGLVWDRDDDDPPECKLNFIQGHCNKEPFKAGIEGRRYTVSDDEPVEPGDHDEEMQKIKGMLDDENNGS